MFKIKISLSKFS